MDTGSVYHNCTIDNTLKQRLFSPEWSVFLFNNACKLKQQSKNWKIKILHKSVKSIILTSCFVCVYRRYRFPKFFPAKNFFSILIDHLITNSRSTGIQNKPRFVTNKILLKRWCSILDAIRFRLFFFFFRSRFRKTRRTRGRAAIIL